MNEEKLADLLADHLDALQSGATLPGPPPDEIAELLGVAQLLADNAPAPRPEFSRILRDSLVGPVSGSEGAAAAAATSAGMKTVTTVLIVVGMLIVLALIVSITFFGVFRPDSVDEPGSIPGSVQTPVRPSPSSGSPTVAPGIRPPGPTRPLEAGESRRATDSLVLPNKTGTALIDVLPPITVTLEPLEAIPSPADLVPGQPPGGSGGGGDRGGGGDQDGDRNRGHGNDSDRHDEDNPGRGRGGDDDD